MIEIGQNIAIVYTGLDPARDCMRGVDRYPGVG
jgi:hypothetical protein